MKKRWKKTKNNYLFDRLIFKGAMGLLFIYLVIVCWSYGFDFGINFYIKCDLDQGCKNPFYTSLDGTIDIHNNMDQKYKDKCVWDWCQQEILPGGFEFGKKPNWMFNWAWAVASGIVGLAFLLNHYLHNKGKKIHWLELEGNNE